MTSFQEHQRGGLGSWRVIQTCIWVVGDLFGVKTLTLANGEIARYQISTRTHHSLRVPRNHPHHLSWHIRHQSDIIVKEQLDAFPSDRFLNENNIRLDLVHLAPYDLQVGVFLLVKFNDIDVVGLSLEVAEGVGEDEDSGLVNICTHGTVGNIFLENHTVNITTATCILLLNSNDLDKAIKVYRISEHATTRLNRRDCLLCVIRDQFPPLLLIKPLSNTVYYGL